MCKNQPDEVPSDSVEVGFAPADYTDDRQKDEEGGLKWETVYPAEARKRITCEATYLAAVLLFAMCYLFFWVLQKSPSAGDSLATYCGAWLGGTIGGTVFSIKWLYHSVAKRIWHRDRLLWRVFTPHVSGVLALFMVLLAASGLVRIFDDKFFENTVAVLSFSFLVGYFSDKALAKMAEVADTLFGTTKQT